MKLGNEQSNHEFHTKLQSVRTVAGITQIEVARRTGITQARISLLECGGARPSQQAARKIADALNCDVRLIWPDFDRLRRIVRAG